MTPPPRVRDEPVGCDQQSEVAFEIAFLAQYDVPVGLLIAATQAARCGVAADQALLGEGFMREEEFYRALAHHLGVPYYCGAIKLAECGDPAEAAWRGIAPLAVNGLGLRHVVAPRGAAIGLLLRAAVERRLSSIAIASPQRLGAIIRFQKGGWLAQEAAGVLGRADPALTAREGLNDGQLGGALALTLCAIVVGGLDPDIFRAICAILLWIAFASNVGLRFAAMAARRTEEARPPLDYCALPVYSIIAPLFREVDVVADLVRALDAIDYPKAKLDIKIVVEERDRETLTALAGMRLPSRYDIIVAPPGEPATKPRALNIALPSVRGDLVVVYDAEDIPAPDQLRRAAARFAEDQTIDCLQARLAIHNIDQSWLTKLFAAEYAALFDVINPGLAALGAPMALGGTSNHFRTCILRKVGSWDAWNVTEDADLGLRLARFGRRVAALDSDTYEEAPSTLPNWFGQRRRWLKGWFQTLIVHTRDPRRFVRELGVAKAWAALALLFGAVLGGLFGPALFGYAVWRCATGEFLAARTLSQTVGDFLTLALMFAGCAALVAPIALALRSRNLRRLYWCLPFAPFYYCLITLAAWAALIDLATRPHHWRKTAHGQARASAHIARYPQLT